MRKFVGTGPSSYKKRFYRATVSQRLRNTGLENRAENNPQWLMGRSCARRRVCTFVSIAKAATASQRIWNWLQ